MLLSCHELAKSYHEELLFSHASFHIEDTEKAAIVGINGSGKTTLVRIILGLEQADDGIVIFAKDKSVGYLAQHQEDMDFDNTIYDEMLTTKAHIIRMEKELRAMEAGLRAIQDEDELKSVMERYENLTHAFSLADGHTYQSEISGVLNGLGFKKEDYNKPIHTLSGGQKTRIALGKILLQKPDIIFLDEPTNHLDMDSIRFLESYLSNYKGAVLLISHDRYFLDKICTKIIEIDQKKVTVFPGSYSDYSEQKKILRTSEMNAYLNQQKEIRHQEEVIAKLKSFNREKSIKRAESREKLLSKIDVLDKPAEENAQMRFKLVPSKISGNDVLFAEGLEKSYGDNHLFSDLHMDIKRGEHVAVIGKNGTGKTTILKIINELVVPDNGMIRLGTNVEIGYYDQEHHVLHPEKNIFDEISDDYPDLTNTQIRNTLAAFLFTGDDVFKKIETLSGGERGRVSLAKLMLSSCNFLILDEPTNHLDIQSKEILEEALNNYEGTVLYVSHDRFFINKTAHRILDLEDHKLVSYLGNYDYYIEKHGDIYADLKVAEKFEQKTETTESKQNWKEQKEFQAKKRKLENILKKTEAEIEKHETEILELESEMAKPEIATDVGKLSELSVRHEALREDLKKLYEEWEAASEESEKLSV